VDIIKASTNPELKMLRISTPGLDLGDLNSFLRFGRAPGAVQDTYVGLIPSYQVSELTGIVKGNFLFRSEADGLTFQGALGLRDVGADFTIGKMKHRLSGSAAS